MTKNRENRTQHPCHPRGLQLPSLCAAGEAGNIVLAGRWARGGRAWPCSKELRVRNLQYTSTVHSKPTGCDPDERALTILRQNEEMSHAKAAASWGSGLQKPSGDGGQHDDCMPREVKRLPQET